MNGITPQEEAKIIFDKYLKYFNNKNISSAKIGAIFCAEIIKDKCSTITEKMYWHCVIKELASY